MREPSIPQRNILGASLATTAAAVPVVASSSPAGGQDAALLDALVCAGTIVVTIRKSDWRCL
ncbi:hypothetical protein FOH24_16905 [Acetobacter tropicalis]|uniref:Uncharacterized protein n=1 Tax=Acetobacter tropicalis TaxID=104102 RepID=A0A094YJV2_9PROT|nr:hypothetical protein [Acetobacter tropicalis]KAA8384065.1 hypothetical protein FOH24_16905 [Acetobacter tropicalis]KAA8385402.1 hypothetical protein FOH22_13645 [Acetobacter tropicalis]KGB20899.1 hypothetical protein AtDm6_3383 [Acetobacter tropicalis]MBC9009118.1 hypothetical protein [Acetobacter tropicalis]MDO8171296.1 hypothetical protein [Acetobacter tropicalis]